MLILILLQAKGLCSDNNECKIIRNVTIHSYIVKCYDKYGIINDSNEYLMQPFYDKINILGASQYINDVSLKNCIIAYKLGDKYGLADINGKILYYPEFDNINYLLKQNRYISIENNNKYDIKKKN